MLAYINFNTFLITTNKKYFTQSLLFLNCITNSAICHMLHTAAYHFLLAWFREPYVIELFSYEIKLEEICRSKQSYPT